MALPTMPFSNTSCFPSSSWRYESGGDGVANDAVLEHKLLPLLELALLQGLQVPHNPPVLPRAPRLFFVEVVKGRLLGDGFAEVDARLAVLRVHLVLPAHALHVDFEVQLAHSAANRLPRLLVHAHAEGGVLLLEALQRLGELRGSVARLGGHREGHDGSGHLDGGHRKLCPVGERGTAAAVHPEEGHNFAGLSARDVLKLVAVHAYQTGYLYLLPRARVDDSVALADGPLVDPQVRELPELPLLKLEGQGHQGLLGVALEPHRPLVLRQIQRLDWHVHRAREVVDHRVEQGLHALVLEGAAHEHGRKVQGDASPADGRGEGPRWHWLLLEEELDAVIDYLPGPMDVPIEALDLAQDERPVRLEGDPKKPLVALAFKLEEGKFGQLTYLRVYEGTISKGDTIINTSTGKKVKVPRLVRMHSNELEDIPR